MTLRIQARRAGAVSNNELVYIGELFYDDAKKRFGVFTNEDATTIRWLPRWFDDNLALNTNQMLTGMVSETETNNIVLDFSAQDIVRVRNAATNDVYLELTPNGAVFIRATEEISSVAGTANLAINGSLSVIRRVGAEETFTTGIGGRSFMFAPNWYVYSYPSSAGMLTASYETEDVRAADITMERAIRISSSGNVSDCGLRSFFYDYSFVNSRFISVTFRVKGPSGVSANTKVLSETDAQLASQTIVGTGNWETVSYPCYMPPSSSKWWAIDLLHEPGKYEASSSEWLVGGFQVNLGTTANILERRSSAVEKVLVNTLYQEGRVFIGNDNVAYPVTLESFVQEPDNVEVVNTVGGNHVVSDPALDGFNLSIFGSGATNFVVKYAAYSAPSPLPDVL